MMSRFSLMVIGLLGCGVMLGCGSPTGPDGEPLAPGFTPLPVPAASEGMEIITPLQTGIPGGTSVEMCTWTDKILTAPINVKSLDAVQTKIGHHAVVFYTNVLQPAGTTRVCTNDDMATFRFLAAGKGEGLPTAAPGDLVFPVPKGMQIVINHHYLNATTMAQDGQSAIVVNYAPAGPSYVPAGAFAEVDTALSVPEGAYTLDINATLQQQLKFWTFFPHMHQWGVHTEVDATINGTKQTLFDLGWQPEYTFNPPTIMRDPADPFILNKGDSVHIRCQWDNTTTMPLTFGLEMCVAFGMTINDNNTPNVVWDVGGGGGWGSF